MRIFLLLLFCFILLSSTAMAIQIVKEIKETGEIIVEKPLEQPVLDLNNQSELPPGLQNCKVIYAGRENLPEEMKALGISEESSTTKKDKTSSEKELPLDMAEILGNKSGNITGGQHQTGGQNMTQGQTGGQNMTDGQTVAMVNTPANKTVTPGNTLLWYTIISALIIGTVIYKSVKPVQKKV
jgi:hypothetical protein